MPNFQNLDVYKCSIRFVALTNQILRALPRGFSDARDQLLRASMSVPLNIAEGCGKTSRADAQLSYKHARGSAMECVATLDALRCLEAVSEEHHRTGGELLDRIVSMLTKMCR